VKDLGKFLFDSSQLILVVVFRIFINFDTSSFKLV
jgi:hypothetical protein